MFVLFYEDERRDQPHVSLHRAREMAERRALEVAGESLQCRFSDFADLRSRETSFDFPFVRVEIFQLELEDQDRT